MKYSVVYAGENELQTDWKDSEAEAITEFNRVSDEPFDPEENEVQGFTDEEAAEIDAYSEAHPQ
jgi:hypothetical protein